MPLTSLAISYYTGNLLMATASQADQDSGLRFV